MNVVDVSHRSVSEAFMAGLLEADIEGWARLQGLLTMMGLPPVNHGDGTVKRRIVEIAVHGEWVAIEGIAVELHRVICWTGTNGSRQNYEFKRGEDIPRWRVPSMSVSPPPRSS